MKKSGYKNKLYYVKKDKNEKNDPKKKRNRKRNIIWFNPPFNKNVKTNVGEEFLKLLDTNFPKNHVLNKILNRQTVKVSYSCGENFERKIQKHNQKILKENLEESKEKLCNCRDKKKCPVENKCQTENVIYKATAEHNNTTTTYIGSTSTTFKARYTNHKHSFNNEEKQSATTLAQHVWNNKIETDKIKWEIVTKCIPYAPGQSNCSLCINEKLHIVLHAGDPKNLNRRSDLSNACPHKRKFKLDKYK